MRNDLVQELIKKVNDIGRLARRHCAGEMRAIHSIDTFQVGTTHQVECLEIEDRKIA
jgi:hypothetical protein